VFCLSRRLVSPESCQYRSPVSPGVLSLKEYSLSRSPAIPGVQPHRAYCLSRSTVSPGVLLIQQSSLTRSLVSPGVQSLHESVSPGIEIFFLPLQLPSCYEAAPLVGPHMQYAMIALSRSVKKKYRKERLKIMY
jgi:hypothetical protein